jgi:hypothetical protein
MQRSKYQIVATIAETIVTNMGRASCSDAFDLEDVGPAYGATRPLELGPGRQGRNTWATIRARNTATPLSLGAGDVWSAGRQPITGPARRSAWRTAGSAANRPSLLRPPAKPTSSASIAAASALCGRTQGAVLRPGSPAHSLRHPYATGSLRLDRRPPGRSGRPRPRRPEHDQAVRPRSAQPRPLPQLSPHCSPDHNDDAGHDRQDGQPVRRWQCSPRCFTIYWNARSLLRDARWECWRPNALCGDD